MIRPTDTFLYYLDEESPDAPAIVCRYGTMAFWMDYNAKLKEAWRDGEPPDLQAFVDLAESVAAGHRNLGDGKPLVEVLTQEQLIGFAFAAPTAARLSEVARKKSARQSQSPSDSSAAAVGESA
jgi:hypothetical protein